MDTTCGPYIFTAVFLYSLVKIKPLEKPDLHIENDFVDLKRDVDIINRHND